MEISFFMYEFKIRFVFLVGLLYNTVVCINGEDAIFDDVSSYMVSGGFYYDF